LRQENDTKGGKIPLFGCLFPADQAGKRGEGRFYGACQFNFEALNKFLTKFQEIERE
jgi:hypothetical protein